MPADELVTGKIENSVITRDAYGLFVSGSNQTQIINNKIRDSIVHGVFMHRFAKNATISQTEVTGSGGDGFVLSRATEKVQVNDCLAENNGRNGFTLDGRALAHGPSASGESPGGLRRQLGQQQRGPGQRPLRHRGDGRHPAGRADRARSSAATWASWSAPGPRTCSSRATS